MNSLPVFPRSRQLALTDKPILSALFQKYSTVISEFTFTNLFAWRKAYNFCLSSIDDCILIISRKDKELHIFDLLCPIDKKKVIIEKAFSCGRRMIKFIRLPDSTIGLFKNSAGLTIEEDRDNFDYVYSVKDLVDLKGTKFDGKRNFIKRFKEENNFTYKKMTQEDTKHCLDFEEEWCLAKDCQHTEGLMAEKEALEEMLKNFKALGISGGMILINGKVEAVTLGEALNPETFVIHMEKANGRFIGIYQAINQMFLEAQAKDFKYVNREQDLGVLGLRQSKESYHPCLMVKKYTLIKN